MSAIRNINVGSPQCGEWLEIYIGVLGGSLCVLKGLAGGLLTGDDNLRVL